MAEILTIEKLLAVSEKTVALQLLSRALGGAHDVRIRRISSSEHLALLPPDPPGSEDWPAGEFQARGRAWFEALPEENKAARRVQARDAAYRIAALACLEPRLSVDQARLLGDDATAIAAEVLRFSGLLPEREEAGGGDPSPTTETPVAADAP